MSEFYRDWKEAHDVAQEKANRLGLDVALRKTKEYGRSGYRVSLASRNDSNYALAEIVRPDASHKRENPRKRANPALREIPPALRARIVRALADGTVVGDTAVQLRKALAWTRGFTTRKLLLFDRWLRRGPYRYESEKRANPRKRRNPGTFTVEVGNQLSGTHHDSPLGGFKHTRSQHVPVRTLQEASEIVRAFVTATGMGGSHVTRHFGEVRNKETGKLIARISYNGRAWTPSGEEVPGVSMTFPLARAK